MGSGSATTRILASGRADGTQKLEACRIAEECFGPEPPDRIDIVGIVVERVERDLADLHDAPDDLSEAAEAGDDHGRGRGIDRLLARWLRARDEARHDEPFGQREQKRRDRHREADDECRNIECRLGENAGREGGAKKHEAELAALRQRQGEAQGAHEMLAAQLLQREGDDDLDADEGKHRRGDHHRLRNREPDIGGHADRQEKEAEQQALEGFDVDLQLVAVFRIRQDDAGGERAEGHRQAGEIGDDGGRGDRQQCRRGEDFGRLDLADDTEERPHQIAAAEQDQCDGGGALEEGRPDRAAGPGMIAEKRERGDERDRGEILEQQHRENVATGARAEQVALAQHRQHDGG